MATRHTRAGAARSIKSPRRNAARSAFPESPSQRLQTGAPRRLRVPAAEADRLRSLLLSDEVGLIGSQDIRKLVTVLEDVYPAQRRRHAYWQPLLMGIGIGLMILAGIMLMS